MASRHAQIGLRTLTALVTALTVAGAAATETARAAGPSVPRRVVSMNLCTDQLALPLAAPGQLVSVSRLSRDPDSSALAALANDIPVNAGAAEEVFVLKPDLVLAGAFSAQTTVDMLRRLGFRVEIFQPESSFADIRINIRRMGDLLGRQKRAEELVAEFDRRLDAALPSVGATRPMLAYVFGDLYSAGAGTLSDDIARAAGWDNLAGKLGERGLAPLPLELIVLAAPALLVRGDRYDDDGRTLAFEALRHPALASVRLKASIPSRYTICGTPETATAIEILAAMRREQPQISRAGP